MMQLLLMSELYFDLMLFLVLQIYLYYDLYLMLLDHL